MAGTVHNKTPVCVCVLRVHLAVSNKHNLAAIKNQVESPWAPMASVHKHTETFTNAPITVRACVYVNVCVCACVCVVFLLNF